MRTLSQILVDATAYLDLTAELPIGDDLEVRINYAQQAVREWGDAYRWKELSTPLTVTATNATISLPTNFKEFENIPKDENNNFYPEIRPADRTEKSTTDKYCYVQGNEAQGYITTFNGLPELSEVSLTYQRHPSNMATLTDICEVPDDLFVVQKVISLVLQSRSDERFPNVEADSQRRLANMIGRNMITTPGGNNTTKRTGSVAWAIGRARG